MDIDWTFLGQFEGGQWRDIYFPSGANTQSSGATVATGVDLGCRDVNDLESLQLPAALIAKLTPYLGKKGELAQQFVDQNPCTVSAVEADLLDQAVKMQTFRRIADRYNQAIADGSEKRRFDDLPPEVQTVICSVVWQYGSNLPRVTPEFWARVTSQDWGAVYDCLNDFKDNYPTRRRAEAAYLKRWIDR